MTRRRFAAAVVVAAGRSLRLGAALPKPFLRVGGRSILAHSLAALSASPAVGAIVVVAAAPWLGRARRIALGFPRVVDVVAGGARRQDSVSAGLAALPAGFDPVLVHDAARPLVRALDVTAVAAAARRSGAAILASPVVDTLKEVEAGVVLGTVDRRRLWRAETPQAARRAWLAAALDSREELTDEAMALEQAGRPVRVVAASGPNLKLTTPADLELIRYLLGRGRRGR